MHIDDLTNSQLVLLVLLIVFVTSPAISVAAIAVINQDTRELQTPVVQTLNRIIERTVEKRVEVSPENTPDEELSEIDVKFLQDLVKVNNPYDSVEKIRNGSVYLTSFNGSFLGYGFLVGDSMTKVFLPRHISHSRAHVDDIKGQIGVVDSSFDNYTIINFENKIGDNYLNIVGKDKLDIGMPIYGYEKSRTVERFTAGVIHEIIRDAEGGVKYLLPSFYSDVLNPGSIILDGEGNFIGFIQDASGAIRVGEI